MRLSFVVPVYNAEKYLDECLSSLVKAGKGYDVEFILVNDGSMDTSISICRRYEAEDNRFAVIDQVNQGSQAARNAGVRAAEGDYICFVDSDDYIDPGLTGALYKVMDSYDPDVILYEAVRVSMKDGSSVNAGHKLEAGFYEGTALQNLLPNMFVSHDLYGERKLNSSLCMKCFKRDILQKVVYTFDSSVELGEDLGITAAAMMHVKSVYKMDDTSYYFYRNNPDSFMNRYKDDLFNKSMNLCDFMARQNTCNEEYFNVGVAYERCFFAISSYYNEYFYKSDRSLGLKKEAVREIIESGKLQNALQLIDIGEVKNPNRMILKLIKKGSINTLSFLGNVIYFISPLLRKVIRL